MTILKETITGPITFIYLFLFVRFLFFLLQLICNVLSIYAVQKYIFCTVVHMYIFSHIILHHVSSRVTIVPCAIEQNLIAYPLQMQQFVSTNPRLQVHPTPSLSLMATSSLFSKSMSFFSVKRLICALYSRYK